MNDWSKYVRELTGDEPQDEVGRKVGVAGSTISRWRAGNRPGRPAEVAALAVAYDRDVLEAFVAAEYLTWEQAGFRDPLDVQIEQAELRKETAAAQLNMATMRLAELQLAKKKQEGRAIRAKRKARESSAARGGGADMQGDSKS